MSLLRKFAAMLLSSAALMLGAGSATAGPVTQLGFALDGSGSVSGNNYNLLRSGLSAAIASLPVDGSVEITIVTYGGSGAATVTAPTILTAATLATIQSQIATHAKIGSGTPTAQAIRSLTTLMTGSALFADPGTKSVINLATDGVPNSQADAVAAAGEAFTAGIDALSIEAIGTGVNSGTALNNMLAIAFPGPATLLGLNSTNIPNPLGGSWVVPVSDFDALAPILLAKVQAAITPVPEPGSILLVGISLLALVAVSRRRLSRPAGSALQFA